MKKFFFYFPNHQHRKTPWIKDVKLDNWKKQNCVYQGFYNFTFTPHKKKYQIGIYSY